MLWDPTGDAVESHTAKREKGRVSSEKELGFFWFNKVSHLVAQERVGLEEWIGVHDRERGIACQPNEVLVAAERREFQVTATLLPRAHDRALAAQFEVDFGEIKPIGRFDHRREAGPAVGRQPFAE